MAYSADQTQQHCRPFQSVLKGVREVPLGGVSTLPRDSQRKSGRIRIWGTAAMKLSLGIHTGSQRVSYDIDDDTGDADERHPGDAVLDGGKNR